MPSHSLVTVVVLIHWEGMVSGFGRSCQRAIKHFVSVTVVKSKPSRQGSASVYFKYLRATVVWELHYSRSKVNRQICFSFLSHHRELPFLTDLWGWQQPLSWGWGEGKWKKGGGLGPGVQVKRGRLRTGSSSVHRGEVLPRGSRCLIYSPGWDLWARQRPWTPALHRGTIPPFRMAGSSTSAELTSEQQGCRAWDELRTQRELWTKILPRCVSGSPSLS